MQHRVSLKYAWQWTLLIAASCVFKVWPVFVLLSWSRWQHCRQAAQEPTVVWTDGRVRFFCVCGRNIVQLIGSCASDSAVHPCGWMILGKYLADTYGWQMKGKTWIQWRRPGWAKERRLDLVLNRWCWNRYRKGSFHGQLLRSETNGSPNNYRNQKCTCHDMH